MIDDKIVTKQNLAEFQNMADQKYVDHGELHNLLTGYVDRPYLKGILRDGYATRAWVATELYAKIGPKDLEAYASKDWVKETFGPLVEPAAYLKVDDFEDRMARLKEDQDLATKEWSRGLLELFSRDWESYATKAYVQEIAEETVRHHYEGLATESWVLGQLNATEAGGWASREWVLGLFDSQLGSSGFASKDYVDGKIASAARHADAEAVKALFKEE